MNEDAYSRLARVLDTLPSGFPSTESGVEIKLLEKIFTPEEASLFCEMRLTPETAEQVAGRTGHPLEWLKETLETMAGKGQLLGIRVGENRLYKMVPWVVGIYEFQVDRIDEEMAELVDQYITVFQEQCFPQAPHFAQTLAVEETIPVDQEALPYEKVSAIIEKCRSFRLADCICKKKQGLLGKPCDRPMEVCLWAVPVPGYFEQFPGYRTISRDEAYALMKKAEEASLVHMTSNTQAGHYFICNCCKCCCPFLTSINETGIPASLVIDSHCYAEIDPEKCSGCGVCADERCQVNALAEEQDEYRVVRERCIGCGLCVSACPEEAVRLVRKDAADRTTPPESENAWFEERGLKRGVDFSAYK
jgi:ferredoxin